VIELGTGVKEIGVGMSGKVILEWLQRSGKDIGRRVVCQVVHV